MEGRIGALHVHYRTARVGPVGAALAPGLDRAIRSGLGEAIGERLDAVLGPDTSVIVIRELTAVAAIGRGDWSLDGRVVDKISRASVDAVSTLLGKPASADTLVRFTDQAEFMGSFMVDLLGGTAWDRWYYGAFQRYRRPDLRGTIEAVLTDNQAHAPRVFGWLARRGHLADLLALLSPSAARRLATGGPEAAAGSAGSSELAPLVAAAFEILDALGWPDQEAKSRAALLSQYLATSPLPPTWTDRRSLTAWLLAFAEFVVDALVRHGTPRRAHAADTAGRLLRGPLDWLDRAWLEPELERLAAREPSARGPALDPTRRILTAVDERRIERLIGLVRAGRLRIDPATDSDALIVKLVAGLAQDDFDSGPPNRSLVVVLERIAGAWHASVAGGSETTPIAAPMDGPGDPSGVLVHAAADLPAHIQHVRAGGPAAVVLLEELVKSTTARGDVGEPTAGAGLFLLTRALLDVRLMALARDAEVPFEPLRAALAATWLDLRPPFDGPTALWVGAASPDLSILDGPPARLADLQQALFELLVDQRSLDALPPDETLAPLTGDSPAPLPCSKAASATLTRIAWMALRAWSRWLPGLGGSSLPFIVRNCLRREARVRVSARTIEVLLDPAPLDVVLEMAGYFRAIELVPWLDRHTVTFTLRRRPNG